MNKKILPIVILSLLFGGVVFAQDVELPDPGLTPDSFFYFLDRFAERIGTFFTFGDIKKAERHTLLAAERLAEAKAVAEKGSFDKAQDKKTELIEKTLERYEDQLVKALARTEKAKTEGKNVEEVVSIIAEATQRHQIVLEEVLGKVPEEAKPAIRHAMIVSSKEGLEMAAASASGQVFSPRAFCTEVGGPPETCEKIPPQGFESLGQIEAYCTETGGPPEVCTLLGAKCREFGITVANECFRFLSTVTLETYVSSESKISSPPSLEIEVRRTEEENRKAEGESKRIEEENAKISNETQCEFKEMIFYYLDGCSFCQKVKNEGTIGKLEELGVVVTQVDARAGVVNHQFQGVPTFVIDGKVYVGYKTIGVLKELLHCK